MEFPEIPGYTIQSVLGKGGMAVIYLAEQTGFKRLVALKVMSPSLNSDPSFAERFMREARTVAQMTHPNFVPVYEVGRHGDHYYMSMEYLPAGDLKSLIVKGIALNDSVRIVKEVAGALDYAAKKNFVHRDIKPANILLREDFSAVICDFGIAKDTSAEIEMTIFGTIIGTPQYMSPEQAQGIKLDSRSDLYSLGVIFYEMLAGRVPYRGDSALDVAVKHLQEPIPVLPTAMLAFQPFIEMAMAKRPEFRFQNGREMILALEELEETQYDLIHSNARTLLLSEGQNRSDGRPPSGGFLRQGSQAIRTGSGVLRPMHKSSGTTAPGEQAGNRRAVIVGSMIAAILGIGAAGWWLWNPGKSNQNRGDVVAPSVTAAAGSFIEKIGELREKANESMEAGRLYGPDEDNAQSYLTTLLVLAPKDSGGIASITRLYGMYLEQASEAIEKGDFTSANTMLNQSSQISFYIEDSALVERQSELRRNLIDAQQQAIIAASREEQIRQLLAEADRLKDAGNLTTPVGSNAYEKYQEVLSLSPSNELAQQGIEAIAGDFLRQTREQLANGQVGRARAYLAAAVQIYPQHPDMAKSRDAVKAEEERLQEQLAQQQMQRSEVQDVERAKRENERKVLAEKVQSLLAGAKIDMKANRLDAPENNNAIEKYKQILNLDPANVDALNGLEDVANRHIEIALGMIKEGKVDEAAQNLERAKILSPANAKYTEAQSELIAVRDLAAQQVAVENARKERIASLFAGAELAAKKGNLYLPRGNNALENLRQILELDSQDKSALALRVKLNDRIQDMAALDIKARRFGDASLAIDALASNNVDEDKIGALRKQLENEQEQVALEYAQAKRQEQMALDQAEQQRRAQEKATADKAASEQTEQQRLAEQRQQQALEREKVVIEISEVEKLLAQANKLGGPASVTGDNYRQLADIYAKVLRREPKNGVALRGMAQASDYAAKRAREAITAQDYSTASDQIDFVVRITPDSVALAKLREDLAISRRQQEQVTEILAAADVLIATPYQKPGAFGNNEKARSTLRSAFSKIESARAIDANSQSLPVSEQKLVNKYMDIIEIHLKDDDADNAQEFISDLSGTGLASGQLNDLRQRVNALAADAKRDAPPSVPVTF